MLPAGLIDWGDIHIGHPGIDLAIAMIFTREAFKIFLNSYERFDDQTMNVMCLHAFCHTMSFLPYAYERNIEPLKRWASIVLTRSIEIIMEI